jgi:protein-disulfide isomerase/uncharacterized membrane protein
MSIRPIPEPAGGLTERLRGARGWRIAFLVLCTVGLCLSADLARLHVKVHTDPDYHAYCAMSERVNCETVATSDWAVTFGLPTAIWGILTYLALAALAVWGLRERPRTASWPFGLLFFLTLAAATYSVVLLIISHFVIGSVCLVCVGTYIVNFLLVGVSVAELKRIGAPVKAAIGDELRAVMREPGAVLILLGAFLATASLTRVLVPTYWSTIAGFGPGGRAFGVTPEGWHWIGASKPTLTIYEFSDYQCPHCLRGHEQMRRLLAEQADRIRLVHRHYPLDHQCNPAIAKPFHDFACAYSSLAHCAGEQSRFWEANDYLFTAGHRRDPVTVEELALKLGLDRRLLDACVKAPATASVIQRDLEAGRAYKIRGTPTFVIGDQTYPGGVPADVIASALGASSQSTPPANCTPAPGGAPVQGGACSAPPDQGDSAPTYPPAQP